MVAWLVECWGWLVGGWVPQPRRWVNGIGVSCSSRPLYSSVASSCRARTVSAQTKRNETIVRFLPSFLISCLVRTCYVMDMLCGLGAPDLPRGSAASSKQQATQINKHHIDVLFICWCCYAALACWCCRSCMAVVVVVVVVVVVDTIVLLLLLLLLLLLVLVLLLSPMPPRFFRPWCGLCWLR